MKTVSVQETLRFSWDLFKKRPWMLIGGILLAMVLSGIISSIFDPADNAPATFTTILMSLVGGALGLLVEMGLVTFALRSHDAVDKVSVRDMWNPSPFLYYLGGQVLVGIAVIIGFILLIVPGVILALGLMFTSYLIIDKNRGPIEAMKESWRITKGNRWNLFLLVLAIIGINILGLLALVVGLLVSVPVSMIAIAHAYRTLEHNANELQTTA